MHTGIACGHRHPLLLYLKTLITAKPEVCVYHTVAPEKPGKISKCAKKIQGFCCLLPLSAALSGVRKTAVVRRRALINCWCWCCYCCTRRLAQFWASPRLDQLNTHAFCCPPLPSPLNRWRWLGLWWPVPQHWPVLIQKRGAPEL